MTSRFYGLLLTIPLVLPAVAQSQNWQPIGQIGGATQAVAVQGVRADGALQLPPQCGKLFARDDHHRGGMVYPCVADDAAGN